MSNLCGKYCTLCYNYVINTKGGEKMHKNIKRFASVLLVGLLVFVSLNFKAITAGAFTSYKVKITAAT
jgi:hypothetical protein